MPVPFSFGAATTAIPLSQLDSNFNTPITLGNTAIQLGNTVTTLNNMTLANVTISSGNVTITNVTVTTANATTVNTTTLIATTANVTTGNVTNLISGNVTLTGGSITGTPISGSTGSFTTLTTSSTVTLNGGTANGVAYLNGSKVLTTGSALTFDGTYFTVGGSVFSRLAMKQQVAAYYGGLGIEAYADNSRLHIYTDGTTWINESTAGATGSYLPFSWKSAGSEQMRLTSTGLGIGTSSPGAKLNAVNTSNAAITYPAYFDNSGAGVGTGSRIGFRNGSTSYAALGYIYDAEGFSTELDSVGASAIRFKIANSEKMRLDSSGNLGLGVTPSAWVSATGFDFSAVASLEGSSTQSIISANQYNANGTRKYKTTAEATFYRQTTGQHQWFTAPSGTAGNAITFTQALTLDASGNLLLGGTSAGASSAASLAIFNGTAPTGSVTNGIILYAEDVSSSSELKVRDEAGNVTTLSPHNFSLIPEGPSEDMAWAYYSEKGGKRINVDMLKLARMVEKLTGEKLVYES